MYVLVYVQVCELFVKRNEAEGSMSTFVIIRGSNRELSLVRSTGTSETLVLLRVANTRY